MSHNIHLGKDLLMSWNYRLVKQAVPKSKRVWYSIHEVFYNDAGKPWTMTEDPIGPEGETVEEVLADLKLIERDLKRLPVLDVRKIKWAQSPRGIKSARKDLKAGLGIKLEDSSLNAKRRLKLLKLRGKGYSMTLKDFLRTRG